MLDTKLKGKVVFVTGANKFLVAEEMGRMVPARRPFP